MNAADIAVLRVIANRLEHADPDEHEDGIADLQAFIAAQGRKTPPQGVAICLARKNSACCERLAHDGDPIHGTASGLTWESD